MVSRVASDNKIKILVIILAVIGGLHNLTGSIIELVLPNFSAAHGSTGAFSSIWVGLFAIFFACLTFIAICYINRNPKLASILMIFSAFGGLISISISYLISFIMVFVAGILIFKFRKNNTFRTASSSDKN